MAYTTNYVSVVFSATISLFLTSSTSAMNGAMPIIEIHVVAISYCGVGHQAYHVGLNLNIILLDSPDDPDQRQDAGYCLVLAHCNLPTVYYLL